MAAENLQNRQPSDLVNAAFSHQALFAAISVRYISPPPPHNIHARIGQYRSEYVNRQPPLPSPSLDNSRKEAPKEATTIRNPFKSQPFAKKRHSTLSPPRRSVLHKYATATATTIATATATACFSSPAANERFAGLAT